MIGQLGLCLQRFVMEVEFHFNIRDTAYYFISIYTDRERFSVHATIVKSNDMYNVSINLFHILVSMSPVLYLPTESADAAEMSCFRP